MANSDVWINGFHLGNRPYGYVSFGYELTPHLNFGKDNVIVVRADTSKEPASRWYTGAGIYRHVRLVIKNAVHIPEWGTFVSTPKANENEAVVKVVVEVVNQTATAKLLSLVVDLTAPDGKLTASSATATTKQLPTKLEPKQTGRLEMEIPVTRPQLWKIGDGMLYRAVARIRSNGKTLDDEPVSFDVR